ncbi:MAG TPA: DUF4905 domain-containing protein [Chryseolinea sp.]|nr:DUF4905 domain-containing protein [Chryseolinea sp.]
MARSVQFNFSHVFEGVIWNTLTSPGTGVLLLEVRDSARKRVAFSALECKTGEFIWREKSFDEPWWISLGAVSDDVVIFTIYLETNNPDKKGVFAYHIRDEKMLWWHNDFSLVSLSNKTVEGVSSKYGFKNVTLDIITGQETSGAHREQEGNDPVIRPHQYLPDHRYFDTVKIFLEQKFNLSPVIALEYLEHDSIVFISFYVQESELANYLFMISADGNLLMKEKLDEQLKGIGLGTFFILSSCVFFVKNKGELVSYKIV